MRSQGPSVDAEPFSIQGDIDSFDGRDSNRLSYEDHRVTLGAGQRVRISAMSTQIDSMVQVFTPGGTQPLAEDDDSGVGLNARLIFSPDEAGIYIVRVLGGFPGLNGPYRLIVEVARPFPDPIPATNGAPAGSTTWTRFDGELTAEDAGLEGRAFDDYLVTMREQEELFVRLDSGAFDPLVQIFRAADRETGFLAADDDSGVGNNSLLLFRSTQAGDYVVRVTSFAQSQTGLYQLRLNR